MVIKDEIVKLLNLRIQQEEMSSRLYKSMAVWLDFKGFVGAGKLWTKYSQEEMVHAEWSREFMKNMNIMPETPALQEPKNKFRDLPQIIAESMQHELRITSQCESLAGECLKNQDYLTFSLAQKYVAEQVEEIAKMQYWIDRMEAFGENEIAMRLLDEEMGESI